MSVFRMDFGPPLASRRVMTPGHWTMLGITATLVTCIAYVVYKVVR